ncbi:MAG: FAD-dependent oxidoreductase [Bacillota bacterium]
MEKVDVVVIGAGPAGLAAAEVTGSLGAKTVVVDENSQPGGQLFKQIHKFFGSSNHYAGTRGLISPGN